MTAPIPVDQLQARVKQLEEELESITGQRDELLELVESQRAAINGWQRAEADRIRKRRPDAILPDGPVRSVIR